MISTRVPILLARWRLVKLSKMKVIKNDIRKTKGFFHAIGIFPGSKIFNLAYEANFESCARKESILLCEFVRCVCSN